MIIVYISLVVVLVLFVYFIYVGVLFNKKIKLIVNFVNVIF